MTLGVINVPCDLNPLDFFVETGLEVSYSSSSVTMDELSKLYEDITSSELIVVFIDEVSSPELDSLRPCEGESLCDCSI